VEGAQNLSLYDTITFFMQCRYKSSAPKSIPLSEAFHLRELPRSESLPTSLDTEISLAEHSYANRDSLSFGRSVNNIAQHFKDFGSHIFLPPEFPDLLIAGLREFDADSLCLAAIFRLIGTLSINHSPFRAAFLAGDVPAAAFHHFKTGLPELQLHCLRVLRGLMSLFPENEALPYDVMEVIEDFSKVEDVGVAGAACAFVNSVIHYRDFEGILRPLLRALYCLVDNLPSGEVCETTAKCLRMLIQSDVNFIHLIGASGLIHVISRAVKVPAHWLPHYLEFVKDALYSCPEVAAHDVVLRLGAGRLFQLTKSGDGLAVPAFGIIALAIQIERTDPGLIGSPAVFRALFENDGAAIRRPLKGFTNASWRRKCAIITMMHAVASWGNLEAMRILVNANFLNRVAVVVEASRDQRQLEMLVRTVVMVLRTAKTGDGDYNIVRDLIRKSGVGDRIEQLLDDKELVNLAMLFFNEIEQEDEDSD
jgi:hypothetical protein